MKQNNHFYLVSITYLNLQRDFCIRNAHNPTDAGDKAMRRAHAIGWTEPTVQAVTEQLLTDGASPELTS